MNTATLPDLSHQRIIVTGGAGFIGSHTCALLIACHAEVLAIDNLSTGHLHNLEHLREHPKFHFLEGDISQASLWNEQMPHFPAHAVIHLAALVSVQESIDNPERNFQRNIVSTHQVLEACRIHQIPRLVFASSSAIFGNTQELPIREDSTTQPLSPYGAAKLASEQLMTASAHVHGLHVIANRYFNVFGPRQDPHSPYSGVMSIFLDKAQNKEAATIFGDGEHSRDFIYVGDIARANVLAASSHLTGFHSFNICTGQRTSLNQLIEHFRQHFPDNPAPTYAAARPGDAIHSQGNPSKAQQQLHFIPQVSLSEGLHQYIKSTEGKL